MKKRMMSRGILLITTLTLISLAACSGQKTVTEQEKFTVTRGNLVQSVNADGALSLPLDRKLMFGASGKIEEMNVEEGDRVTKGKVLARLEMASLERTIKTAELAISSAQADQKQAELGIKTAEADYKQVEDSVKSAAIDLEMAADSYRKMTYPYTFSTFAFDVPRAVVLITEAQRQLEQAKAGMEAGPDSNKYGQALTQFRQAQDNLAQAQDRLKRGEGTDVFSGGLVPTRDFWTLRAAQLQVDKVQMAAENAKTLLSKSQIAVENARIVATKAALAVDKARYDIENARDMLDKAVITAPFDGVVAKLNYKVGDSLTVMDYNATVIQLVDPSHMELTVDVDEIDIPDVKIGQEVTISIDALPGSSITGKVIFISPLSKVESGVVLYAVKISFDVPEKLALRAGMSASANIITARRSNVLMVPTKAITQDTSGKHTVKLLVNGKVEERSLVIGISDNFNSEVVSGLGEGDTVVIERQVKTGAGGIFG